MAFGIAQGSHRFFAYKSQTAHGTRASGFTTAVTPMRSGSIFKANAITKQRQDAINAILPYTGYYQIPKIVNWKAGFYLVNPTTAHPTVRDFLRSFLGKETTAVGPPITKTFVISDPLIDGAADAGSNLFGRALTLHEETQRSDGTLIYAHEVQDAVIEDLKITWVPDAPILIEMSGLASDLQDGATTITPVYPDGALFLWSAVKDTTTAGLRIGTANPPVATDNVIFSKATLHLQQKIRYLPFLGAGAGFQVRIPTRDDLVQMTMDVEMDVEGSVASQYDATDVIAHWKANTDVNLDFLSYIDATDILDIKCSATPSGTTHRGCFIESFEQTAQGYGAMRFAMTVRFAPSNPATDLSVVMTNVS